MEEREVLIGLSEIEGVGWETIQHVVDTLTDIRALLKRPAGELLGKTKIAKRKITDIERFLTKPFIEGKLNFYERCGVAPVTIFDSCYPPLLRFIHKPPWILYTIGNVELLQRPTIAIVGTRNPTPYGREVAEWFGRELAGAGFAVVSGLARGIDSYAHAGALRANGSTVAVLGNGLNVCYPPEHHALQRAIGERGLVISEYGWNAKPSKVTFPWRNRIIAGMSRGTVVVEASERSGSLITTDSALEAGRDVFAIPGLITSPKSAGVYRLIREGAKIATRPSDVAGEYGVETGAEDASNPVSDTEALTEEEAQVLEAMGVEPATIDELLIRTEHTFGHLHTVLLSLLIKKRIRALPGSAYIARMN
jgi:DNA processing protein